MKKMKFSTLLGASLIVMASLALSGCASTQAGKASGKTQAAQAENQDPFEGYNRIMFSMNDAVDTVLMEPIARGYRAAVPHPVRTGVSNFLDNLRGPVKVGNLFLQGDLGGAAEGTARFAINSTVGVAGVFDVAKEADLKNRDEDFGQTLGVWGFDHGAYVVLPIIGPSSVRDGIGLAVDSYADPLRIYLRNIDENGWEYGRMAAVAIDDRESLLDTLEDLQKHSLDYYAAVRSAYYQHREAAVKNQESGRLMMAPAIPDYSAGEQD